jgi:tetratricopeptide (TPR) repeat protein
VLTGVWDEVGEGLELQATLADAAIDTVVYAFEPIPASREEPREAIATLRDWVLMAVQDRLHPALAFAAGDRFPKYEAYEAYRDWFGNMSVERWQKVLALDPDFLRPRITGVLGLMWGGQDGVAEAFLEPLEADDRLTLRQRRIVGGLRDQLEGRWEGALEQFEWLLDHGHDNYIIRQSLLQCAVFANRPRRALEHFQRLGPPPFGLTFASVISYNLAADAYHLLGRYEQELELAQRFKATDPFWGGMAEARALVALGRFDDVEALVTEALTRGSHESPGHFLSAGAASPTHSLSPAASGKPGPSIASSPTRIRRAPAGCRGSPRPRPEWATAKRPRRRWRFSRPSRAPEAGVIRPSCVPSSPRSGAIAARPCGCSGRPSPWASTTGSASGTTSAA